MREQLLLSDCLWMRPDFRWPMERDGPIFFSLLHFVSKVSVDDGRNAEVNMPDKQKVLNALKEVQDPHLKRNLVDLGMIKDLTVDKGEVNLTLALTTMRCPLKNQLVEEIKQVIGALTGVSSVDVQLAAMKKEERKNLFPKHPLAGINKVKHTLAVASGKGGVGKTSVAVNVALALQKRGHKVGLLDADIYGPSIPFMLNISEKPEMDAGMLIPVEKYGLKTLSIGMMLKQRQAIIWRGPLVSNAIRQLLHDVMWSDLDYLIIDLPPGTGDPSITITQELPEIQILMVTTPQEVALIDVRRAVELFAKMKRQVLGFVENMSYFQYADSQERLELFGSGGGKKLSQETGLPLLGAIPIDMGISKSGDGGVPLMIASQDSKTAHIFLDIAAQIESRICDSS